MNKLKKVKDWNRINKHQRYFRSVLPKILPAVKNVQYKLRNNERVEIITSRHSKYREVKREISYRAVLEVLRWGRVIEFQGYDDRRDELEALTYIEPSDEPCINVIMMKKVYNNGRNHYVHVCVNIQGDSIIIKTVYDPKSMYWQWMDHYSKRVFYKYEYKNNEYGYNHKPGKRKKQTESKTTGKNGVIVGHYSS